MSDGGLKWSPAVGGEALEKLAVAAPGGAGAEGLTADPDAEIGEGIVETELMVDGAQTPGPCPGKVAGLDLGQGRKAQLGMKGSSQQNCQREY